MSLRSVLPEVVGGRYEVQRLLGRGGMADVYEARDVVLGRPVALKVLRDPSHGERFRSEALTLARLSHPGLVTVLDAGVTANQHWLVMELIDGVSLAERCSDDTLAPGRVAQLGAQLADALDYVHTSGFVHRDVKPGNVLLARDDRALLADFGIARLVEGAPTLTDAGFAVGTAAYLAPEQLRGEPITPAADVFSLGLVLLEALTGERAYPGTPAEAAAARLTRPPTIPPAVPEAWRQLLTAMTDLDPLQRPAPAQLAEQLRAVARSLGEGTEEPERAEGTAHAAGKTASAPTRQLTVPFTKQLDADLAGRRRPQRRPGPARRVAGLLAARAGSRVLWLLTGFVLVLLIVAVLVLGRGHGQTSPPAVRDSGVPAKVTSDLQRLNDAVNGR